MHDRGCAICICVLLLAATTAVADDSSPLPLRPWALQTTGVQELCRLNPDLTGAHTSIALVELATPTAGASPPTFMPNLQHRALQHVQCRGCFCYAPDETALSYSQHASLIAGILLGQESRAQDIAGLFTYRGIVPRASLAVYETKYFTYNHAIAADPAPVGADVISMSYGSDAADPLTMFWQRGVDALAVRDGCVIVAGAGNGAAADNTSSHPWPQITKPSWGYNVISVAAARGLGVFPDSLQYIGFPSEEYSTPGPTDDGRAKPDVIAPGLAVGPRSDQNDGYFDLHARPGYSSFAAPVVAGVAALLVDAARQLDMPEATDPRVVRALILNGAVKLAGWHRGTCDPADDADCPLDYRQGAGLVNAVNAYNQLASGPYDKDNLAGEGWCLDTLALDPNAPNARRVYHIEVPEDAATPVAATLIWHRHYDTGGLYLPQPLSRLTLELWRVDFLGRLVERLDYCEPTRDNVAHIYTPVEAAARLALVVRSAGPGQQRERETFALAWRACPETWRGDLLPTDLNLDGVVDGKDVALWTPAWIYWREMAPEQLAPGDYGALNDPADFNLDGRIDPDDFAFFARDWNKQAPWRLTPAN